MPAERKRCHPVVKWLSATLLAIALAGCTSFQLAVDTAKRIQPEPEPEPTGSYKVGKPYQVAGQWYYPKADYAYNKRGVASWYGPNFDGRPTANGERFDMRKVSAAHKTLPLPSVVRVTNLENGRSLILRVNDRGPFVAGRIIDLSKRAAELLGFADKGTAMVEVQIMVEESRQAAIALGADKLPEFGAPPPEASPSVDVTVEQLSPVEGVAVAPRREAASPTQVAAVAPRDDHSPPPYGGMSNVGAGVAPPPAKPGPVLQAAPEPQAIRQPSGQAGTAPALPIEREPIRAPAREESVIVFPVSGQPEIFVQAGAFARYDNANRLRARLTSLGHPVRVTQVYITQQPMFRVRVGPLRNVQDADRTLDRIVVAGYPDARIVID